MADAQNVPISQWACIKWAWSLITLMSRTI